MTNLLPYRVGHQPISVTEEPIREVPMSKTWKIGSWFVLQLYPKGERKMTSSIRIPSELTSTELKKVAVCINEAATELEKRDRI